MVASTPPSYRSNRPLYYTDKAADSANIGSIITTFKAIDDVYDNYKAITGEETEGE